MADIVVAGELIAEFLALNKGQNFSEPGRFLGPFPSGAPAIFADQASLAGASVSYVGSVGNDAFGDAILKRLSSHQVDIKAIKKINKPTALAFVSYQSDGSRQFVYSIEGSATSMLGPEDINSAIFEGCRYLHIMGSTLNSDQSIRMVQNAILEAKKVSAKISFDPNIRPEMLSFSPMKQALEEVFSQCNLFLPSEADLPFFFEEQYFEKNIQSVFNAHKNLEQIVLKLGNRGSIYFDPHQKIVASGYKVDEVDPTGAGDCFAGTFIACLIQNIPVEQALSYANGAGALAVSTLGPMEGNGSLKAIQNFIASVKRA